MNRDFLKKALTIPMILAVVLAAVLFICLKVNLDEFLPLYNNTQYAFHDEIDESKDKKDPEDSEQYTYEEDKNADPALFEKNQCIGVIRAGKGYPILYDMDYSKIQSAASYNPQSVPFGETGFAYINVSSVVAKEIKKASILPVGSVFGEKKYEFIGEYSFGSEYNVLNYAPRSESAIVIYYHDSNGVGFTSKYKALVYKEVK